MRKLLKTPLFAALLVAFAGVNLEFTPAFDHMYWNLWYKIDSRPAPSGSTIVSLDGGQAAGVSTPAGSTSEQARLVDGMVNAGARRIYLDFPDVAGIDPQGDRALYKSIERSRDRVIMINRAKTSYGLEQGIVKQPAFKVPQDTRIAVSAWDVNLMKFGVRALPAVALDGALIPSVALVGDKHIAMDRPIFPDFAIDPDSIPVVDASVLLDSPAGFGRLRGQNVFVTSTNRNLDTTVGYFGHGIVPAAKMDISGILAHARPTTPVGDLPLLLLTCLLIYSGHRLRGRRVKVWAYTGASGVFLATPAVLTAFHVHVGFGLSAMTLLIYAPARAWQKWRQRVQMTSSDSGLPNVKALAEEGVSPAKDVIAVSISQYEQMLASLPRDHHGECARQIARRLSIASDNVPIYDNGSGHFVWVSEPTSTEALVAHLEGVKALFASPVLVDGHVLDTNVHFGVDRNCEMQPISRIKSAMASASEAQEKGNLFEEFGQQRMAQAPWELSLHARIDEGLRNGDIWLAYQPKIDLRTNRISGAEALIRWNDPERGAIPPDAFILQAERAGRIDTITYWVLERAIDALEELSNRGLPVRMSVNLSARMIDRGDCVRNISEIVRRREFDCSQMMLEVTETFNMANHLQAKENLASLRAMGFGLSIDDFGTGQASLAYLSEIPSDEIKLDKRFVQAMETSSRDRAIVNAMIQLAHDMGQEVVAEGVEETPTLAMLRGMGCDLAQGYLLGRPVRFAEFARLLKIRSEAPPRYG